MFLQSKFILNLNMRKNSDFWILPLKDVESYIGLNIP